MRCIVVTPEKTVLDMEATFVALPLYDGELGVAPKHTPLIGRLGVGELRVVQGNDAAASGKPTVRYYVEGGFAEVLNDTVTLLTGHAVPLEQLNATQSRQQLDALLSQPAMPAESVELRDHDAQRLRTQLRLASR